MDLEHRMMRQNKGYIQPEDFKRMTSGKLFKEIDLNGLIVKKESLQSSSEEFVFGGFC